MVQGLIDDTIGQLEINGEFKSDQELPNHKLITDFENVLTNKNHEFHDEVSKFEYNLDIFWVVLKVIRGKMGVERKYRDKLNHV
jgi:hypothetical protein